MKPFSEMEHHPLAERFAEILCSRTHSTETHFFRVQVAYFFSMAASMMGTQIKTHDQGNLPVNLYAINLAPSGFGKGKSINIIEETLSGFREEFVERTFPLMAEENMQRIADRVSLRSGRDPVEELTALQNEFVGCGPLMFSFDSGTEPALKQFRHKLLLGGGGSLNLQIDEIGLNLLDSKDLLKAYLELYDKGYIKTKLVKFTADSKRNKELVGATPANLLLFGTPSKLFDGGKIEEDFHAMLDTGYARRSFFGYVSSGAKRVPYTAAELYAMSTDTATNDFLDDMTDRMAQLADPVNQGIELTMTQDVATQVFEYMLNCQERASKLTEYQEVQRTELSHRYFKSLKLAGAYAFIDGSPSIEEAHLHAAIKMAEESGEHLKRAMNPEPVHSKLARFIAHVGRDVTQHDLVSSLPFYKGTASAKADMMSLAISWGYKNNILIKKAFQDGIEFLSGESLEPTNLNELVVSHSSDMTTGYNNDVAPFDQLHVLTQLPKHHWLSHHVVDGYRSAANVIDGFNMIVIDVDGELPLAQARTLLKDYKYHLYTTKSSTPQQERFRIVFPTNYKLKLDEEEYKEFMKNVFEWLPWELKDTATGHRSKKWLSHAGHYENNDGQLLDVLPFIPKTSKNETHRQKLQELHSLDSLERWFISNTGDGNRNNQLVRYAFSLVDAGFDEATICSRVVDLNEKLPDKLEELEIHKTIMVSVAKRIAKQP